MAQLLRLAASLIAVVIIYLASQKIKHYIRRKGLRVPPGPGGMLLIRSNGYSQLPSLMLILSTGLPFIGNLRELTGSGGDLIPVFGKWSKEYGPIMQFSILGEKQVLLGTHKVAQNLLAKRGAIYSDRGIPHAPRFVDDHNLVLLNKDGSSNDSNDN